MKGFGPFREPTDIDFTDIDLVALVGDTGSGKSTIIDALTFALYGSVARYQDNRAVAPVINQTSQEARVAFDFEIGGRPHTAVRVVRRTAKGATTREARLEQGERILADDARSMTAAVEELLGLDADQFNRTVVLPQGRFADFLHDTPKDRQATLRNLLGLELYRRLGGEARSIATTCRDQAVVLKADLATDAEELTDEKRAGIAGRIEALETVQGEFIAQRVEIEQARAAAERLGAEIAELDARLEKLRGVDVPDGVAEIDARLGRARDAAETASEVVKAARDARRTADEAVAAGPDLAEVTAQLRLRADHVEASGKLAELSGQLQVARTAEDEAVAAADAVRLEQERRDDAVAAAQAVEEDALATAGTVTSSEQLDAWAELWERHAAAVEAERSTGAAHADAAAALVPLENAVTDAEAALEAASGELARLRREEGVAAHADLLAVGEQCPLCHQTVQTLPEHRLGDDLQAAAERETQARASRDEVLAARDAAKRDADRAEARRDAAADELRGLAERVGAVPAGDEIARRRSETEAADAAVAAARAEVMRARLAADEHRRSDDVRAVLSAEDEAKATRIRVEQSETSTRERVEALAGRLDGVPDVEALQRAAAEAERLRALAKAAVDEVVKAETAAEEAVGALGVARVAAATARTELQAARDRVAALEPPALGGEQVAADWATLATWAAGERSAATTRREEAHRTRTGTVEAADTRTAALVARVREVVDLADEAPPLSDIADRITAAVAETRAGLRSFDERCDRLAERQEMIDDLTERGQVAEALGRLLRADGFERWLMREALEHLVSRATVRLFELSGGQYSLELDDANFVVRDHANADEIRSARTLSGGETFLASLSLALALADATAELAPEGAPQIESIFLDEGFGTLDAHTLDTVATAIEDLGASGRLVGIITHIRELADRMPVRLEVTKSGGASTVERVVL
ncbi:MAG: SMC family ATPase [Acidimicrobiales bacterium]